MILKRIRSAFGFVLDCLRWDKDFRKTVLAIALPMIVQQLVAASLHIVDGLMVSAMGDAAYSAVTQANRLTFIFNLFCFGSCTGSAIFLSQYWGARDIKRMRSTMGLALSFAVAIAIIFMSAALLFPRNIISLFLPEGESFELAVRYLVMVAPGYLFMAIDSVYGMTIKAAEKTYIPMISGMVSIAVNTLLNYALIFGNFGMPKLGVEGAAIATVVSAFISMSINVSVSYIKKLPAGAKLRELLCRDAAFVKKYIKTALPVVFNEGLWALGMSMYSVFYGQMGDTAVASTGMCNTINDLVWTGIFGLMNSTAIIVGKTLGSGDREKSYLYAKRMLAGAMTAGAVLGVMIICVRYPLVGIFSGLSQEVRDTGATILMIGGLTIWFRAFNTVNIVGILRSGGDTLFSLVLDIGTLWLVGVPIVGVAALVLKLPIEAVYALTIVEEAVKMVIGVPHFKKRKWMNVLTGAAKEESVLENA